MMEVNTLVLATAGVMAVATAVVLLLMRGRVLLVLRGILLVLLMLALLLVVLFFAAEPKALKLLGNLFEERHDSGDDQAR
jgi:predicted PurR-regulated permease PerM